MTPRQLAGHYIYYQKRARRELAAQLSNIQVATSQDKKAIKARTKALLKGTD